MPSALPLGEPAPTTGELPADALARLGEHPFGVYVHVPFCSVRCGYCDFNTYTLTELGVDGASIATYADAALAELDLAAAHLGGEPGALLDHQGVGRHVVRLQRDDGIQAGAPVRQAL
ncbi:MAG: radical SAM family heme chaperone HemW, partial [Oryzihumus sp.]